MSDFDDFFAKKDKKKKTKKGFNKANTDVLAKNLEENDRKEEQRAEKETAGSLATSEATKLAFEDNPVLGVNGEGGRHPNSERNDEEWLDYENEKKDYTGLKIESLQIAESEENNESDHEFNEEGEKVKIKKQEGGPWKKLSSQDKDKKSDAEDDNDADETDKSEKTSTETTNATSSNTATCSYVPPHLRNRGGASSAASTPASGTNLAPVRLGGGGGGRRNRAAPNMDDVNFPSLSLSNQAPQRDRGKKDDFEEVRSGGTSQVGSRSSEAPKLTLENKFSALRE